MQSNTNALYTTVEFSLWFVSSTYQSFTWWLHFMIFFYALFYVSFSKLSDPLEEAMRSKYSLSIPWHKSVRFLYCRTMLANLLSGRGVVSIVKICPKTSASNSVGLKDIIYMNISWKSGNLGRGRENRYYAVYLNKGLPIIEKVSLVVQSFT